MTMIVQCRRAHAFSPLLKRGVCVGSLLCRVGGVQFVHFQSPIKAGRLCWHKRNEYSLDTVAAFSPLLKRGVCVGVRALPLS